MRAGDKRAIAPAVRDVVSEVDRRPLGTLGVGPGYAMAAKLARPDSNVVLVYGDGSFGLHGLEFEAMARHQNAFAAMAAFVIARYEFRGRQVVYYLFVGGLFFLAMFCMPRAGLFGIPRYDALLVVDDANGADDGRSARFPFGAPLLGMMVLAGIALTAVFGLGGLADPATRTDRIGDLRREQPNRTQRIVVTGDDVIDLVADLWSVPAYLRHADVLLVPHVVDAFTDSLDPIKLYEYRAGGRPGVAAIIRARRAWAARRQWLPGSRRL